MNPLVVLGIGVTIVFVYDGYLLAKGGEPATISVRFYLAAKKRPVIPFLVGVLIGHLVWGNLGVCP